MYSAVLNIIFIKEMLILSSLKYACVLDSRTSVPRAISHWQISSVFKAQLVNVPATHALSGASTELAYVKCSPRGKNVARPLRSLRTRGVSAAHSQRVRCALAAC